MFLGVCVKKLFVLFCVSLFTGGQLLLSGHGALLSAQQARRLVELEAEARRVHEDLMNFQGSGTIAHSAAKTLNTVGNMYVRGHINLSPTEAVLLWQLDSVSKIALGTTVVTAAAGSSEWAQRCALVGMLAGTASTGYKFWRGYRRSCQ